MADEKPKPEVLKGVLDEFARRQACMDFENMRDIHHKDEEDWLTLRYTELATLALERGIELGKGQGKKEKMCPDSITMDLKEFDELVVSNDARKDIIERQKERIAQLERDAIQQKVNYRKALEDAKQQGKLDQSFLCERNLGKKPEERVWKYLKFVELKNEGKKTKIFLVVNREEQVDVGVVKWYGAWRQYAFFPERDTLFERVCLRDIADFLDGLREERLKSQLSKSEGKEVD